jgi:hypothetical protein
MMHTTLVVTHGVSTVTISLSVCGVCNHESPPHLYHPSESNISGQNFPEFRCFSLKDRRKEANNTKNQHKSGRNGRYLSLIGGN